MLPAQVEWSASSGYLCAWWRKAEKTLHIVVSVSCCAIY